VFLTSRIREEWLLTRDARRAVHIGLARGAGVITSAAAMMIAVFGAFVLSGDLEGMLSAPGSPAPSRSTPSCSAQYSSPPRSPCSAMPHGGCRPSADEGHRHGRITHARRRGRSQGLFAWSGEAAANEMKAAAQRGHGVRKNGGALDGVRALPAKGRTSRSAAASVGRWDIPRANDVYRRTWRTAASREGCQFRADDKGKGKEISLLAILNI
jgi:hypothetical protein